MRPPAHRAIRGDEMSDFIYDPHAASEASRGSNKAVLARMAMPGHLCPFGLKSKSLLERKGFALTDIRLESRDQTDAFMAAHDVETTPQTWIDGKRIGGHDALRRHLGQHVRARDETTYRPILAIFGATALMALAIVLNVHDGFRALNWLKWFFALSMCALAIQKLRDVEGFSNGFLGYDLLARRYVPYAYAYPYLELFAGTGMIALIGHGSAWVWLVAPISLFIGTVGALSVIKAVYIEERELTCACVGGNSNVPLGSVSLTENLIMMLMGIWMIGAWLG